METAERVVVFGHAIFRCTLKLVEAFYFLIFHQQSMESMTVQFTFSQATGIANERYIFLECK